MPNEISSYLQACMRLPIMVHLKQQILFHFRSIRKRYLSMNISSSCYCLQGAFIKAFCKKIYNNFPSLFWQKNNNKHLLAVVLLLLPTLLHDWTHTRLLLCWFTSLLTCLFAPGLFVCVFLFFKTRAQHSGGGSRK